MRCLSLLAALVLVGCIKPIPPAPAPAREAMPVAASFGKTWDAVIDQFAQQNIPIRTMERASGFIAAEPARVPAKSPYGRPHPYADCGSQDGQHLQPTEAFYNIVVRGDSAHATVLATVRWNATGTQVSAIGGRGSRVSECSTRGLWETEFETAVKARAEGK